MKILSLLMLLALGLLVGCSSNNGKSLRTETQLVSPEPTPSPTPDKPSPPKQIEKRWDTKFEFMTRSIKRSREGIRSYEISVDYPEIKERTPQTLRFNRWIREKVLADTQRFKRLEQRAEAHDRKRKLEPARITEGLEIWFDVYYADENLISLRLTHSVMALGQMHPIDYYETINYDLQRGRILQQQELFKRGYLKVFSQYSRTFIRHTYDLTGTTDDWLDEGTKPRQTNFPNWNIVPDGVLVAFEDYQIGSHSFGQLELIIPYTELKGVLRPNRFVREFGRDPKKNVDSNKL